MAVTTSTTNLAHPYMAGRIPRDFIDDLLARTDIVEVVNRRVPLKKKGREYAACCPFHSEKTPSFFVNREKQFYHCFGCGAHGSAIGFLMEYDHLDFISAVETLATDLGLEVPREGGVDDRPRENLQPLYKLLADAAAWYQQMLKEHPNAIDYLKQRGLSGEIARDFMIGYAPAGWTHLLDHFAGKYDHNLLTKAGLTSQSDSGRIYDKFRDRIMFPIRDRRGRVIAFGGRVTGQGEPKYLNSPETPVFNKSATLYGLYEALRAPGRPERLIIVEGYMDVVALAQNGIRNAVATLGTATTAEHVRQLFQLVSRVVFCFDGDRAGREAAWRALGNSMGALRDGKEVDFLFLPESDDPDSYVRREGKAAFEQLVDTATPLSAYLLETLKGRHDVTTMEGRTALMLEARQQLKPLHEGLLRSQIETALEQLTQIPKEKRTLANPPPRRTRQGTLHITPMRLVIAGLLQQPALAELANERLDPMIEALPGFELLDRILRMLREKPELTPAMLVERFRETPYAGIVDRLASWHPPIQSDEDGNWSRLMDDAFGRLRQQAREKRLEQLLQQEMSTGKPLTAAEKEELVTLLRQ